MVLAELKRVENYVAMVVGILTAIGIIAGGVSAYKDLEAENRHLQDAIGTLQTDVLRVEVQGVMRDEKHDDKPGHDKMVDENSGLKTGLAVQSAKVDRNYDAIQEIKALLVERERRDRLQNR